MRTLPFLVVLILGAVLAGHTPARAADKTPAAASNTVSIMSASADMRAAFATPQDIAEGKRVAQATCARCHGMEGLSTGDGVPHIAGQRPVYMHLENKIYKNGGRGDNPMSRAVKFLSEDALMKVSAYYASLEPAQPVADKAGKAAPPKLDPVSAGKAAAAACADCHGDAGITSDAGSPSLVGLDPKYFVSSMKAYMSGQRKNSMMKKAVQGLGETDINNMALFYAMQKPGKAKTPAPGNIAAGKAAAASCALCHGETGVASKPEIPSLAGQDAEYFVEAMRAYRDGSRVDQSMSKPAAGLNDNALRDMAAFYASQTPQMPKIRKPLALADLVERCDRCHGVNGNSTDPRSPALAAQRTDYHERVLRAYQKGERKSPEMAAMSPLLSDADIEAIAAYYARQRARSVVYVILQPPPAK